MQYQRRDIWFTGKLLLISLALVVVVLTGCLGDRTVDRAEISATSTLEIRTNGEAWSVGAPGEAPVTVRESITVDAADAHLVIIWQNQDERSHEIMMGHGHTGSVFHLGPGDTREEQLPAGFEGAFHSHGSPELPELQLSIRKAGR